MELLREFLANVDDGFDYSLLHGFSEVLVSLPEDEVELLIISRHRGQPVVVEENLEEL